MEGIDWKAAVSRVKRVSIETYQAGKVKWDPATATTVFVEQVTSNEPWGPTSADCRKVADLTFDWTEAQKAMEVIWRRLGVDAAAGAKNWRKVHKTLALLEFLLKHGSLGVIDDAAAHGATFAALSRFGGGGAGRSAGATSAAARLTTEERDADEGCRLIRAKAKALLELLDDVEALARCRADAQRNASRYVGMGSDSFRRRAFGSFDGGSGGSGGGVSAGGASSSVSSAFGSPVHTSTAGSPRQGAATPAAGRAAAAAAAPHGVRPFSLGGTTAPGASRSLDEILARRSTSSTNSANNSAAMEEYAAEAAALRATTGRASSGGAFGGGGGGDAGAYRPPQSVDASPAKPRAVPVLAPPPTRPRFKAGGAATAAAAVAARPTATAEPGALDFDSLFAGVELASSSVPPSPRAEDSSEGAATAAASAAKSVDPFAELLDVVDDRINAAKVAGDEPLCAEAAVTWNVGGAPLIGTPPTVESLLAASSLPLPSAAPPSRAPDAVEALLIEDARRRLASVRLPAAPWGPGSSLQAASPPPFAAMAAAAAQQPMFGAFATGPPAEQAPPQERSLIDL